MKPLLFREVRRKLEAAGFIAVGQTGSHIKFAKTTPAGTLTAIVPKHALFELEGDKVVVYRVRHQVAEELELTEQ